MNETAKLTIAVLFGGKSTEHEVSCISAYSVLKNIDKDKFNIKMIGITKDGDWIPYYGSVEDIKSCKWDVARTAKGPVAGIQAIDDCDVVFPVLHGLNGEDGTIQGMLELTDKPYVGCNVLASVLGMDKAYSKIIFKDAGIPQCKHIVINRKEILNSIDACIERTEDDIGYPCFIKPSNSGSSVGVYKCRNRDELVNALNEAQKLDRRVLIEVFVKGREIECAVLGNDDVKVAIPGEIIPSKDFYDYEDKYLSGTSVCKIPADLSENKIEEVKDLAAKAYKALDCSGLSRVDFFYVEEKGQFLLNEINTLPGFTEISMYGRMWQASGITNSELLTKLIELAIIRKQESKREF